MSDDNLDNTPETNGQQGDIEKLQAKNGEIIGKNKELKEANTLFSDKISTMEATLKNLGALMEINSW